jgi:benzoate membrane transport protein
MTQVRSLFRDWSLSATLAGFLAVLISYSGPLVIFFYAAKSANVSSEILSSWVWAISIGAALSGIYLSWRYKTPVVTAWSAPGTALLISLFPGLTVNEAIGSYLVAALITLVVATSGSFDWLVKKIPRGISAGMLAGILFQFSLNAFKSVEHMPTLSVAMIACYVLAKKYAPRYLIILVFMTGITALLLNSELNFSDIPFNVTYPTLMYPSWSLEATLSFTLPLVLVSLTGQFLPGMTILKMAEYKISAKPIMTVTGLVSLFMAFFGGISTVIAAITAAICTGKDAHPDPDRRYVAGIANGIFYLIGGIFSASIVGLFTNLPTTFIAVLAGLALLAAISANVLIAVEDQTHRESALLTFLVTSSGMTLFGIGSAFWGVVLGLTMHFVLSTNFSNLFKK